MYTAAWNLNSKIENDRKVLSWFKAFKIYVSSILICYKIKNLEVNDDFTTGSRIYNTFWSDVIKPHIDGTLPQVHKFSATSNVQHWKACEKWVSYPCNDCVSRRLFCSPSTIIRCISPYKPVIKLQSIVTNSSVSNFHVFVQNLSFQ